MKKLVPVVLLLAMFSVSELTAGKTAFAEEAKMVGSITRIEMSSDSTSAVVTLKDSKTGEDVLVVVADEQTLDKFKDKRIVDGDEIRSKFDKLDGKNIAKMFKKTAGC